MVIEGFPPQRPRGHVAQQNLRARGVCWPCTTCNCCVEASQAGATVFLTFLAKETSCMKGIFLHCLVKTDANSQFKFQRHLVANCQKQEADCARRKQELHFSGTKSLGQKCPDQAGDTDIKLHVTNQSQLVRVSAWDAVWQSFRSVLQFLVSQNSSVCVHLPRPHNISVLTNRCQRYKVKRQTLRDRDTKM